MKTVAERFWAKVRKTDRCWLWTAYKDPNGYARIKCHGVRLLVHRLSWAIHRGQIAEGLFVLHSCDVPYCVNPEHLFLGTQADNITDCVSKGRHQGKPPHIPGEANGRAKLTTSQVLEILSNRDKSLRQFARELDVNYTLISRIRRGKCWAHLQTWTSPAFEICPHVSAASMALGER